MCLTPGGMIREQLKWTPPRVFKQRTLFNNNTAKLYKKNGYRTTRISLPNGISGVAKMSQSFYYIDILDPWSIKSTPQARSGVSGVSKRLLVNYTNTFSQF